MSTAQIEPASPPKVMSLIRQTSRAPVRTIAAAKGQPYLLLGTTSNYSWLYDDSGSHSHMDATFWRPKPTDPSYYLIGDYVQGYYGEPTGPTITVTAVNDRDNPLLRPPVDYREIWNDHGSGGHNDGSVWYPVPPDNFVSVGFVCQNGYDKPSIADYRCVHKSQVVNGQAGSLIWRDQGSGAHQDVSIYAVQAVPGIFVAQGNYDPYVGSVYQFKIE